METVGLIAGGGRFPILLAQACRQSTGARIEAVGFHGATDLELENHVDNLTMVAVGQLGKMIKTLKSAGVTRAIMAGKVEHKGMFEKLQSLRFDMRGMKLFMSLPDKKADTILGAVAKELESDGITLIDSTTYLKDLLPAKGVLTDASPNDAQMQDIESGKAIASEMGRLDVGQTVVVKNKSVVAVEAIEGTDEAIRRGAKLSRGEAVVVKMAKPGQDMRFDVPVIGPRTIETMHEAGASVLAICEGKTLVLEPKTVVKKANEYGIAIVVIEK